MLLQDKKIVQILHFYFEECYNKRKKLSLNLENKIIFSFIFLLLTFKNLYVNINQ